MDTELMVNRRTELVNVVGHDLKLDDLDRQLLGYLITISFSWTLIPSTRTSRWYFGHHTGWYWREWTALRFDRNLCSIT
jgi:hypothetical protein